MILANRSARIAGDPDRVAEQLEDAFRRAQRADALDIIAAIDPTPAEVAEWDDLDWHEIAETTTIPTPVGTRNAVLAILSEQGR